MSFSKGVYPSVSTEYIDVIIITKKIGFWIESLDDEKYQPPHFFVEKIDPVEKELVAEYLDRGVIFCQYRGYSWCRFKCDAGSDEMGSSDLTDGEWVWPSGLSSQVCRYQGCTSYALKDKFFCVRCANKWSGIFSTAKRSEKFCEFLLELEY